MTHRIDDQDVKVEEFKELMNVHTIHQDKINNIERVEVDQLKDDQKFRILVQKYENKIYSNEKGQEILNESAKMFQNQQIQISNVKANEYKDIFNSNKDLNKIFLEQKFFQVAQAFKYKNKIMKYMEKIRQYNPYIMLKQLDKKIQNERKQEFDTRKSRVIKKLLDLLYVISKLGLDLKDFQDFVVHQPYQIKDSKKFIQKCRSGEYFEVIQMLDIRPQFIVQYDFNENRGLHWAAKNNHLKLVELLIIRGSNIEATNQQGLTALYSPTEQLNILMVRLLLYLGAKTNNYDNMIFTNCYKKIFKQKEIRLVDEIKHVYKTARNLRIKLALLDKNQRKKIFIQERVLFIKGVKQFQCLMDGNYKENMTSIRLG